MGISSMVESDTPRVKESSTFWRSSCTWLWTCRWQLTSCSWTEKSCFGNTARPLHLTVLFLCLSRSLGLGSQQLLLELGEITKLFGRRDFLGGSCFRNPIWGIVNSTLITPTNWKMMTGFRNYLKFASEVLMQSSTLYAMDAVLGVQDLSDMSLLKFTYWHPWPLLFTEVSNVRSFSEGNCPS